MSVICMKSVSKAVTVAVFVYWPGTTVPLAVQVIELEPGPLVPGSVVIGQVTVTPWSSVTETLVILKEVRLVTRYLHWTVSPQARVGPGAESASSPLVLFSRSTPCCAETQPLITTIDKSRSSVLPNIKRPPDKQDRRLLARLIGAEARRSGPKRASTMKRLHRNLYGRRGLRVSPLAVEDCPRARDRCGGGKALRELYRGRVYASILPSSPLTELDNCTT